ncbi:MAG: gamma carbonic anhydrase family protein [Desulfarculaceae bacterium]|nr:gamma carbonic anhydrase family protein [Desulfarculaceae bacterium]MCF8072340.1 gamma carbonic anhydrase family protein [Desulfarculaceae bacterium]MCF8100261.1 gamma carbonic anhydrase family protein [Desulfarculaceae bacterium]MCF8116166.1 gamma carbonic anhydrase family protein [Desulfarculaceae bacterium]
MINTVNGKTPRIDPSAYVAPGAVVVGDVELGPESSVWYQAVLRGDINWIRIGARSNIQDGTIVHVDHSGDGTLVGSDVIVGHRVILHSCVVEDACLIGMGAVLLNRSSVGEGSIVAAGAVLSPGFVVPPGTLAAGVPAKIKRDLTQAEQDNILAGVGRYRQVMRAHQDPSVRVDFSVKV